MAEMTREVIVASCKANGGYESPKLNDQLFLHCKGFVAIKNLEPYTNVKVLWLEQNAISDLSGLENQRDCLVSLFLQNNTIRSLQALVVTPLLNLRVLNISHNYLTSLKGIAAVCPYLETLQVSHNHLASLDVCRDLWQLSETLTSVDLSYNKITQSEVADNGPTVNPFSSKTIAGKIADSDIRVAWEPEGRKELSSGPVGDLAGRCCDKDPLVLVHFFKNLPNVSVIYIHGNGITHEVKNYRRNMILHLPNLAYLDERPVFSEERRVVEAWGRGGDKAETEERAAIREEKREHLKSCVRILTDRLESSREARDRLTQVWERQREGELRALERKRQEYRDVRDAMETAERSTREAAEKEEQNARWDFEELFEKEHELLTATERERLCACQESESITRITAEAARELAEEAAAEEQAFLDDHSHDVVDVAASSSASFPSDPLTMLLHSDDDILREMENTIQHVLYDVELSVRSYSDSAQQKKCTKHLLPKAAAAMNADKEGDAFGDCSTTEAIITASYSYHDRATEKAERATHDAIKRFGIALCQDRREHLWKQFQKWENRLEHR